MTDDKPPNERGEQFDDDLHFAAQDGDLTRARALLAEGRSPNVFDELLVDAGADPPIPGWMQLTALGVAKTRKRAEGLQVFAVLQRTADRLGRS
jgi:hypothetical protein